MIGEILSEAELGSLYPGPRANGAGDVDLHQFSETKVTERGYLIKKNFQKNSQLCAARNKLSPSKYAPNSIPNEVLTILFFIFNRLPSRPNGGSMNWKFLSFSLFFAALTLAHANSPLIKADGSSTVFPVTEAVSEEFQSFKKGKVRLTVGISGTGGGFKKFCRGETDIQNASRPILVKEMEECRKSKVKYFELPVGFDAIAIVVNPKNTWLNSITIDELNTMWGEAAQGKIMKWKQVNPAWPDSELKLYGAGADSGTFDYFTEAITGKSKSSRGDFTASEDDNTLVLGVSNDKGGLAFLPLAYYESNKAKLKLVPVVGGPKSPKKTAAILPNKQTVIDGSYYPLSRPIFIYVSEASYKKPEVKEFMEFYLKNASTLVSEVNYIPLPPKAYLTGAEHLKKNKLGTAFGGHPDVGLTIEQILKKEASL